MNKAKYFFVIGIFSIIPFAVTIWLINWVLTLFASPVQPIVDYLLPESGFFLYTKSYLSLLTSILLTTICVIIVGYLVSSVFGRLFFSKIETKIARIPIVNTLYQTIKGLTDSFSNSKKQSFSKVVLIEYPKENIWTIALVTGESKNADGKDFYHLFLPSTPNPTTGYMLYTPFDKVTLTSLTPEEAIKIIMSGGTMSPDQNEIIYPSK